MKSHQTTLSFQTRGRGTSEITREVQQAINSSGLCHIFIHHTSASLTLCKNADPSVRHDLETFMARLVPDGDPMYQHSMEGPDDMPTHIRSILTKMDLTIHPGDRWAGCPGHLAGNLPVGAPHPCSSPQDYGDRAGRVTATRAS